MRNTILAIESSCDDTSASVIKDGKIMSNIISSQIDHAKFGGVVPEIASRAHQKNIVFTVDKALNDAKVFSGNIYAIWNSGQHAGDVANANSFALIAGKTAPDKLPR